MKKFIIGLALVLFVVISAQIIMAEDAAKKEYVGVKKCKMCHFKQFKAWSKMKHSKALSSLQGKELKNPECVKCHTTGFEKGGYSLKADEEANENFKNVQCEACHGPGSLHMKAKKEDKAKLINKKVDCTKCHNPHIDRGEQAKEARAAEKE